MSGASKILAPLAKPMEVDTSRRLKLSPLLLCDPIDLHLVMPLITEAVMQNSLLTKSSDILCSQANSRPMNRMALLFERCNAEILFIFQLKNHPKKIVITCYGNVNCFQYKY